MCEWLFTIWLIRNIVTIKNRDPIKTCNPWKPVAIKKEDPKEESVIEKGASIYSNICKVENNTPINTVMNKEIFALLKFFF